METNTQSIYITDAIKNYEPTERDLFIYIDSGEYQRMIFGEPQKLKDEEEKKMEDFNNYITANKLDPLPEFYRTSERYDLRFLQGSAWDHEQAYKDILANYKWMQDTFPLERAFAETLLQSGAVYVMGRAKGHQPVMVWKFA